MASAAIYVRISRDSVGDGAGVKRQEADCRALCERNGWPIHKVYSDASVSAFSGVRRPAYEQMCAAIMAGQIDRVVVWAVDRLYRRPQDLESYIDLCTPRGVPTHSVRSGELDLTSADGRMMARIFGAFARGESEKKAERHRRANEQRAAEGKPHVSRRPFGYEQDGITIREPEAEAIRWAFQHLIEGGSLRSIAKRWNDMGLRGPQKGNLWSPSVAGRTLRTARLAGIREYRRELLRNPEGDLVRGTWPPIVSFDTWQHAQAILRDPRRRTNAKVWSKSLLAGIAICGSCGHRILSGGTRKGGTERRYRCGGGTQGTDAPGACFHRAAQPIDRFVTEFICSRIALPEFREAFLADGPKKRGTDTVSIREQIRDRERLKTLSAEDLGAGLIDRSDYLLIVKSANQRIADLEAQLPSPTESGVERLFRELVTAPNPQQQWARLDIDAQRLVVRSALHVVIHAPGSKEKARVVLEDGTQIAHPESVTVQWLHEVEPVPLQD